MKNNFKSLVVNCSQIFCTFAVETTEMKLRPAPISCELLSNFLYFCSRNNAKCWRYGWRRVVNCSQIFCTFAVETTPNWNKTLPTVLWIALKFFVLLQSKQLVILVNVVEVRCELLSNFLYFCSRNNQEKELASMRVLWIALKFFVLLQSKQRALGILLKLPRCELLSNFLYFCSRNNLLMWHLQYWVVVNCSQIFCTFAVETTYL